MRSALDKSLHALDKSLHALDASMHDPKRSKKIAPPADSTERAEITKDVAARVQLRKNKTTSTSPTKASPTKAPIKGPAKGPARTQRPLERRLQSDPLN